MAAQIQPSAVRAGRRWKPPPWKRAGAADLFGPQAIQEVAGVNRLGARIALDCLEGLRLVDPEPGTACRPLPCMPGAHAIAY